MTTLLVISGLDPSGGAGFLADARVAHEHGVRVVGVVTAHTVQDTSGVRAVEPIPAETLADSLDVLLGDVEVDAVKIGMLGTAAAAEVIARALAATRAPVIWDPIIMPSRGGVPLLRGAIVDAVAALLHEVRLVTPNLTEAAVLTRRPVENEDDMRAAAAHLRRQGAAAVLVKGGHLRGDPVDILDEGEVHRFAGPRLETGPLHGTGCVLSTAIACNLAKGQPLRDAVGYARAYQVAKLSAPLSVGRGARCLV